MAAWVGHRQSVVPNAAAVCRVRVGSGTAGDALRMMAMQPLLWAGAAALALSFSQQPLPATVRRSLASCAKTDEGTYKI